MRILGNILALYLAYLLVPGFVVNGTAWQWAVAGIVLALLNMTVKPILKALTFPIIILTLGLFTIVINALIVWMVDYAFPFVSVADLAALVWATIVIGIVNMIVSMAAKTVD